MSKLIETLPGRNVLLALTLSLFANAAWADDSEIRDLSGFHAIHVGGGIHLTVHQGDHYAVKVRSDSGDAEQVETEVKRDTLEIRKADQFLAIFHWFTTYSAEVTLPVINKLTASGGAAAEFVDDYKGDQLSLVASGGGNIEFLGKVDNLEVVATGGSDVSLGGSADTFKATASGGSDLRAMDFEVKQADLFASGGSNLAITVHDKISVRASGGSVIRYGGHPKDTDIKTSGGSRARSR